MRCSSSFSFANIETRDVPLDPFITENSNRFDSMISGSVLGMVSPAGIQKINAWI